MTEKSPAAPASAAAAVPSAPPAAVAAGVDLAAEVRALAALSAQVTTRLHALEQRLAGSASGPAVAPSPTAVLAVQPAVDQPESTFVVPGRSEDAAAEIRSVLRAMFDLALGTDPDDTKAVEARFEPYRDLVHSLRKGSPLLNQELFNYKWRPLCTRVRLYLGSADPGSFTIVQMAPEAVDQRTESVRVFLKADKRMPPPITLRRDERAGGAFRIETSSL